MILKASERGNAGNLARHLMNTQDNEHVELHELRGFMADDLGGALQEAQAISRGTRCKNFLFSLSLSPPAEETVPVDVFEAAIGRIEHRLGLEDHARAIVFHEKDGRRHAHAVWSRIDPVALKATNLPHYKRKLNEIARDLFLEHGWQMPGGFKKGHARDPLTFSLAEWQQAKRAGRDPKSLKQIVQRCWHGSDSGAAFQTAMRTHGLFLARGDRRGVVALDLHGEVYAVSRLAGVKAKELKARLSDTKGLPSVDEQRKWLATQMTDRLRAHLRDLEEGHRRKGRTLEQQRQDVVARHRAARHGLRQTQSARWQDEDRKRAARLPRGLRGLWSWITGDLNKIRRLNALEVSKAEHRDRAERQELIAQQLSERRRLQALIVARRSRCEQQRDETPMMQPPIT